MLTKTGPLCMIGRASISSPEGFIIETFAGYTNTNGLFLVLSYALFPRCFSVVHLDNKADRNTGEGFCPPSWLLGRFERLKTIQMGTNTPHTCIPGIVWQKQVRPHITIWSSKSANSDFPFTLYALARHYTTGCCI